MSGEQQAVIIALAVAATLLTRAIPFILFPEGRERPQTVRLRMTENLQQCTHIWVPGNSPPFL